MLALTQAASGEPATDARWMTLCSNEFAFCLSSFCTSRRASLVMPCASKLRMESMTPRLPKKDFIEFQEVSKMPMIESTPWSTSRTGSGGILRKRSSSMLFCLMPPTAFCASSISLSSMPSSSSSLSP